LKLRESLINYTQCKSSLEILPLKPLSSQYHLLVVFGCFFPLFNQACDGRPFLVLVYEFLGTDWEFHPDFLLVE
jgi:hypothetical protein